MKSRRAIASLRAMNPVRILQVGLGGHGRNWARRVLPDVHEVEVVGYVDSDPQALDLMREEIKPRPEMVFESLKEAISATQPEGLLNTTALPGHVPVTRAALDAGLHVIVEKPFAPTIGAAQELADIAGRAGRVLMVSQNYRYFPATRAIAALVK